MKQLKAIASFFAFSFVLMLMPLNASTTVTNVPVVHGAWTFIGVADFQTYGGSSSTTSTGYWGDGDVIITDAAAGYSTTVTYTIAGLEVPTWDGNWSDNPSTDPTATLAYAEDTDWYTPRPATNGNGIALGTSYYGTVGLMVTGQSTSGATSSTTDHNGVTFASINYTGKAKDHESPIRTMYIRSSGASAPDIKISYQADYEGDTFYVRSTTTTDTTTAVTYSGTFNRDWTYENPAVLGTNFVTVTLATSSTAGNDVTGIVESFDMNLTDNNISSSSSTGAIAIAPSTTSGSLRATLDGNLTVLSWDATSQEWRVFRTSGDGTSTTEFSANDFTAFEKGKGYWIRLDRDGGYGIASTDYSEPAGFVLGKSSSTIDYSSQIADGWNMMAFNDDFLSYSTTGVIITPSTGDLNITDTYGSVKLELTGLTGATAEANCSILNAAIDGNNSIQYSSMNIKCIPSASKAGGVPTMVLLSNRKFTVQGAHGFTDLLGVALSAAQDVNTTSSNYYSTRYGAYSTIIEPNGYFATATGNDGNLSVKFLAEPTVTTGASAGVSATLTTTDDRLQTAMDTASANVPNGGSSTSGATNYVIPLDINYSGTDQTLLVSSSHRFYLNDWTLVRVFNYDDTAADLAIDNGVNTAYTNNESQDNNTSQIRIIGKALTAATSTAGDVIAVDENLSQTVANIEIVSNSTEVNATKLDSDDANVSFMLYYTGAQVTIANRIAKVDLQEWGVGYDLFTEVDASTESNRTALGAVARVWNISTLVNTVPSTTSNAHDGNYSTEFSSGYTSDMRNTPHFVEAFPISGPLYDIKTTNLKNPELFITGQTATTASTLFNGVDGEGSFISWKTIDTTVPTAEWYDADNQFELFWTEKEKGYWVYIDGDNTIGISFTSTPVISGTVYQHFDNDVSSATNKGVTRNHMDRTLSLTVTGLVNVGTAVSNVDSYEVYATINGTTTSFERTGSTNTFTIPLDSHETNGLNGSNYSDSTEVTITIDAADGAGETVSTTYLLDFAKPDITAVSLSSATASVTITNGTTSAATIQVYSADINDSDYGSSTSTNWAGSATITGDTTDVNLGAMTALAFTTNEDYNTSDKYYTLGTTYYDTINELVDAELVYEVRFVAVETDGGAGVLYSDQYQLYYLPIYSGSSILSSSDSSSAGWDADPTVYTAGGVADTTWTDDDGVELKTAVNGTAITISYKHQEVKLDEAVPTTREIRSGSTSLGLVTFVPAYDRKPFYVYVGTTMYVGYFDNRTGYEYIDLAVMPTTITGISIVK